VALNVLSFDTTEISNTVESVKDLLNSSEAVELQMGAVDCIESLSGADGVLSLLGDWKGYSPRLRKHIISTMLKRRESTVRLLRELEIKSAMVSAFSITQIAGLRRNADTRISELADRVFGRLQDSDRTRLVEQYRSSLELNGNPEEGKAHFAALCAACHKVGEIGFDVGPDLASLTDKSPASMLIAILDPNRSVEDKYSQYFATTGQGRNLSGILAEETATRLTFVNTGGLKQEVLRQNLSSLESSEASLMPEGFEAGLDSQGLADLIAFLGNLGSDLRIRPDEDRSIGLLATRGIAEGSSIRYDEESGAFEWMAESDSIEWTVYGLKAGYYDIFSDASLAAEYEGRPFTLELNERFVTGFISTTGGSDRFRKRKFGNIEIESNLEVARFKLRHSVADGLLSLRELRLIPVDDGE
jgi:putative heme-binding domain-containing protein